MWWVLTIFIYSCPHFDSPLLLLADLNSPMPSPPEVKTVSAGERERKAHLDKGFLNKLWGQLQIWFPRSSLRTKRKHFQSKIPKTLTKINLSCSNDRLIDPCGSDWSSFCVCVFVCVSKRVWLTQVRRQPGRLVLHSAGWPRGGSMDGGGSRVWQRVRGRTERAPLLLWIDTETQSMAHKALRCTGPEPKQHRADSPHLAVHPH